MPRSIILSTITLLLLLMGNSRLKGQCPAALPPAPCTGSEPLVVADETITTGTTKWYYGATATFNSLTLRGGNLVVCGDLTIDKFYMDSGQIIINPGARFVVGSGIGSGLQLFGYSAIYNYGTLEVQRNITMENGWATPTKPNIIVNASTTAVFKMPNQYFVINNANSWFVNRGSAQFWGLITDVQSSPSSVCLGYGSTTLMAILINKVANTYKVTSGTACLYVQQLSQFFGSLTTSPNLFACLSASHHSDVSCVPFGCTPNAWGSAQVFLNCNSCAALITLPVGFVSFGVSEGNGGNIVKWEFEPTSVNYLFYIERSEDGKNFYTLDSVTGSHVRNFSYTDATFNGGMNYYRVRYADQYTKQVISKTVSIVSRQHEASRLYPSPFSQSFFVQPPAGTLIEKIIVYDMTGKNIAADYRQQGYRWQVVPLITIKGQKLIVQIITNHGVQVKKIMQE